MGWPLPSSPTAAEVCYPSAGYAQVELVDAETNDYKLKIPGSDKTAGYRAGFFSKKLAGLTEYQEVIYSFRHAGDWVPDATNRWKRFRSHPGMFKIQIARQVNEISVETSPSVELLGTFMQEIEKRLPKDPGTPAKPSSASQVLPTKGP